MSKPINITAGATLPDGKTVVQYSRDESESGTTGMREIYFLDANKNGVLDTGDKKVALNITNVAVGPDGITHETGGAYSTSQVTPEDVSLYAESFQPFAKTLREERAAIKATRFQASEGVCVKVKNGATEDEPAHFDPPLTANSAKPKTCYDVGAEVMLQVEGSEVKVELDFSGHPIYVYNIFPELKIRNGSGIDAVVNRQCTTDDPPEHTHFDIGVPKKKRE